MTTAKDVCAGIKYELQNDSTMLAWVAGLPGVSRYDVAVSIGESSKPPGIGELPHVMIVAGDEDLLEIDLNDEPHVEQDFFLIGRLRGGTSENDELIKGEFINHIKRIIWNNYTLNGTVYNARAIAVDDDEETNNARFSVLVRTHRTGG